MCLKQLQINLCTKVRFKVQHSLQNQPKKQSELAQTEVSADGVESYPYSQWVQARLDISSLPLSVCSEGYLKCQCSASSTAGKLGKDGQCIKGR